MMSLPKLNLSIDHQDLLCPILHEILTDPVMAADGHTYERESITNWFQRGHKRSPLTGQTLIHTIITDNIFAKRILREAEKASPQLELIRQAEIKTDLEKCINEKEDFISQLIDKVDRIIIDKNASLDVATASLNRHIEYLKNLNVEIEETYLKKLKGLEVENYSLLKQLNSLKLSQFDDKLSIPQIPSLPDLRAIKKNIDFSKAEEIQTLTGHSSYVYSLIKVSENVIASGSDDNTIKLWKEVNGKFQEIQTLTGHSHSVYSLLKVSENVIASGSEDKTIKLWQFE
jgi:hypothetical protein